MNDTDECRHGTNPAWCAECTPPKGLPPRVLVAATGQVFHRTLDCSALQDGQIKARHYGKDPKEAESLPTSDALAKGLAKCAHCFHNAPNQGAPGPPAGTRNAANAEPEPILQDKAQATSSSPYPGPDSTSQVDSHGCWVIPDEAGSRPLRGQVESWVKDEGEWVATVRLTGR